MQQLRDLADERLFRACAYCGGVPGSRDHVPSRTFLDEPFPTELPVVGACIECNNGFSQDEEYVACLIECAAVGSADPALQRRAKIANILRRAPALQARLAQARIESDRQVSFTVESTRLRSVLLKLAKGHAMFELSWFASREPTSVWWSPIDLLGEEQRANFEEAPPPEVVGEIGTRSTQRIFVLEAKLLGPDGKEHTAQFLIHDWVDVQQHRYRYLATDQDGLIRVRIVIGEYLACEVVWQNS